MPAHVTVAEALASFNEAQTEPQQVTLCGRVTAVRSHGKASFLDLKDITGRIQLYIKRDLIGEEKAEIFAFLDIADFVAVTGEIFKTHTGEITLKVKDLTILAKTLRPLPEKWHGLKDVEIRYRQRYLDLISNEEVKKVFQMRSRIIKAIRNFLDAKGFLEVETPMMHDIAGGAAGRPFKTHHNEYDVDLFFPLWQV